LSLYQTMYHWRSIVVVPGYTQPDAPGGDQMPYDTAHPSCAGLPEAETLAAARRQGHRLATHTELLVRKQN
jgi:hypothetical protein